MVYSKRQIQRILKENGWTFHHQTGSHAIYKNENGQHLTLPIVKCNKMLVHRLIKEYGLEVK